MQWVTFWLLSIFLILACSRDKTPLKPEVKQPPREEPANQYYYYNRQGEKILLEKSSTLFTARFTVKMVKPAGQIESYCASQGVRIVEELPDEDIYVLEVRQGENPDSVSRAFWADTSNVKYAAPLFYRKDTGEGLTLTDMFVIRLKEVRGHPPPPLESGVEIAIHSNKQDLNRYVLRVRFEAGKNALEMANLYREKPGIEYAYPSHFEEPNYFIYSGGLRFFFWLVRDELGVQFVQGATIKQINSWISSHGLEIVKIYPREGGKTLYNLRILGERDPWSVMRLYQSDSLIVFVGPVFYDHSGLFKHFLTNQISVLFYSEVSEEEIEALNVRYGVSVVDIIELTNRWWKLELPRCSELNALTLSKIYFKEPIVWESYPAFLFETLTPD